MYASYPCLTLFHNQFIRLTLSRHEDVLSDRLTSHASRIDGVAHTPASEHSSYLNLGRKRRLRARNSAVRPTEVVALPVELSSHRKRFTNIRKRDSATS